MNKLWTTALCALLLGSPAVGAEPRQLVLADAWVRTLPPGQPNTAAYLTITNNGTTVATITGATANLAKTVEFHTTREVDGLRRMEQVQGLTVAAGQSLQLAPGGTHLMLFGLDHMPEPDESVQLCLRTGADETICTDAVARKSAGAMQGHAHH